MDRYSLTRRSFLHCMGKSFLCTAALSFLPSCTRHAAALETEQHVIGTAESIHGLYAVRLTVAKERILHIEPLTPATRTIAAHRRAVSDALMKLNV